MVAGSPQANGKVSPYSRPMKSVPMNDGPLNSGNERIYGGQGVSLAGGDLGSYELLVCFIGAGMTSVRFHGH